MEYVIVIEMLFLRMCLSVELVFSNLMDIE